MIVNPLFFYLMHVCDNLDIMAVLVSIFGGAAAVFMTVYYWISVFDGCWDEDDKAYKLFKRVIKIVWLVVAVAIVCVIVLPKEETLLMMQAASLATTENVNLVFDALKSAMDYAVSVLK